MVALLPGSRVGEAAGICPFFWMQWKQLSRRFELSFVLATPMVSLARTALAIFRERIAALSIQVVEGDTADCIGNASLALAASGTVTVEAAILGTPTVTYYKVTAVTWAAGRRLVKVPFLSMVNLIAGRLVIPEFIQTEMTAANLVRAASELLEDPQKAERMRSELARVRKTLDQRRRSVCARCRRHRAGSVPQTNHSTGYAAPSPEACLEQVQTAVPILCRRQ